MQPLPDISTLMKIAQSPAGQKLLTLLQSSGGSELDQIVADASSGNLENAKKKLSSVLSSQEAQLLLKQLEENL